MKTQYRVTRKEHSHGALLAALWTVRKIETAGAILHRRACHRTGALERCVSARIPD